MIAVRFASGIVLEYPDASVQEINSACVILASRGGLKVIIPNEAGAIVEEFAPSKISVMTDLPEYKS